MRRGGPVRTRRALFPAPPPALRGSRKPCPSLDEASGALFPTMTGQQARVDKCSRVSLLTVHRLAEARAFAAEAYGSEAELEHPDEVAALVGRDDEELAAAAILHDLVEDTDVGLPEIAAQFGSRVAGLVGAMTEDESIERYKARKQEHRRRARESGRDVALLFVADKVSNARRMQRGQKEPDAKKIRHYRATLQMMRETYPDLPLLDELEKELAAIAPSPDSPASEPATRPGARA